MLVVSCLLYKDIHCAGATGFNACKSQISGKKKGRFATAFLD
jgi:hypothetical protein